MNKIFLLSIVLGISNILHAQIKLPGHCIDKDAAGQIKEKLPPNENNAIFIDPEVYPEFPGGEAALHKYLKENLIYPDSAFKQNIQGRVLVKMTIEEDGSISDVIIRKPLGFGMDEEALRVIKHMPKWKPASVNGKPVSIKYQIPVKFALD